MDLLEGRKAKKAGIVYLEDESYAFECNGRTWSVYGSPVSLIRLTIAPFTSHIHLTVDPVFLQLGVQLLPLRS